MLSPNDYLIFLFIFFALYLFMLIILGHHLFYSWHIFILFVLLLSLLYFAFIFVQDIELRQVSASTQFLI